MKPSNPLVSIIIPIYNVQDYLEQCLVSVARQTYRDLEILCIIDGGQDDSAGIAQDFAAAEPRCRVLTQPNQGLSVARNNGVRAAAGQWVFFLDADDWLADDAIEALVVAAPRDGRATISGAVMEYWEESGTTKPYIKPQKRRLGVLHLQRGDFFAVEPVAWNKLYPRELVAQTPFTPGLVHEDLDFYWRAFAEFPEVIAIPQVVVFYRRRSGTLSRQSSYAENYQDHYIRIVDNAFAVVGKHPRLRYHFLRQSLKYLKYIREKNAASTRYERHIGERYGIRDTAGFRFWLKLRRLLGIL